jgi:thioesterase domain-containing protein
LSTYYNKLKVSIISSTACSVSSEGKQTSFLIQVDFLFEIDESQKKVEEKYLKHKAKFIADKEREEKRKLKEEQLKKENLKRLTPTVKEISAEEAEKLRRQEQMQSQPSTSTTQSTTNNTSTQQIPTQTKVETKPVEEEKKEEYKGEKPNSGNGGSAPRYVWTQKLEDLQINIPVDQRYKGKDLDIKYKSKSLFVGIKNGETIIDGEFPHPIKVINNLK